MNRNWPRERIARRRGRVHARTYALHGELEVEEREDIERLVFCQLIYSYELAVRRNIFFSEIKDQNKRRTRCAHS